MTSFQQLTIKGGPHGKNVEIALDGSPIDPMKTQRVELVISPVDAVRAVFHEVVEARVDVPAQITEGGFWVEVRVARVVSIEGKIRTVDYEQLVTAAGATVVEALRRAADKLEAKA